MSNSKNKSEFFEAWRKEQIASLVRTGRLEAAKAFEGLGSIHWMAWQCAWQASLDSVVIELPPLKEVEYDAGYTVLGICKTAIESAGLKVSS